MRLIVNKREICQGNNDIQLTAFKVLSKENISLPSIKTAGKADAKYNTF